jgi:pyridoxamine 5'-phosphate oxidase
MIDESVSKLRQDYRQSTLLEKDVPADAFTLFTEWFNQAKTANVTEVNAMNLCTVDSENKPQSRIVLLKSFNPIDGFIFFTNYNSNKSKQLIANPNATILFAWLDLERQVRIQASATKISVTESELYFASRPRQSQLGAWASDQSAVLKDRESMENIYADLEKQYENKEIPMPAHWGGWALKPTSIEFWQGRTGRLHDRLLYTLNTTSNNWSIERLAP